MSTSIFGHVAFDWYNMFLQFVQATTYSFTVHSSCLTLFKQLLHPVQLEPCLNKTGESS